MLNRRAFIATAATLTGGLVFACRPQMVLARADTDRRLVMILQRGAADGLGTVIPTGDPQFTAQRRDFAADADGALALDSDFKLHSALAQTKQLYDARQALFAHAVASPYRDRSHFDGQNVLETGGEAPYRLRDGWLNRLLGLLPGGDPEAIAISATVPAILRGSGQVSNYAPSSLPDAEEDLLARVTRMYAGDSQLHALWDQAIQTEEAAGDVDARRINTAELGALAAQLMEGEDGARLAVIETGGWDTHSNQRGRLASSLRGLDAGIAALRDGLGPAWADTLVIVATEFGRTVAPNGTAGTDHGTASAAMFLGGTVQGGRVVSDWPGLGQPQLYQGRDLKPTMELDAMMAGATAAHFGIDPARAQSVLFPSVTGRPVEGLVAA